MTLHTKQGMDTQCDLDRVIWLGLAVAKVEGEVKKLPANEFLRWAHTG